MRPRVSRATPPQIKPTHLTVVPGYNPRVILPTDSTVVIMRHAHDDPHAKYGLNSYAIGRLYELVEKLAKRAPEGIDFVLHSNQVRCERTAEFLQSYFGLHGSQFATADWLRQYHPLNPIEGASAFIESQRKRRLFVVLITHEPNIFHALETSGQHRTLGYNIGYNAAFLARHQTDFEMLHHGSPP